MKVATIINAQKVATFFWILAVMAYYNNWGPSAYVYLAVHGTYGFCWMIKELAFPNASLQKHVPWYIALLAIMVVYLPGYWTIPILALSQLEEASGARLCIAIMMYTIGIVTMMVSDCQTYWILKYRPGQLITEGMNRYIRHPNYAGEVLLYSSFAVLARHWGAWVIVAVGWLLLMVPQNLQKEESLGRYPAWSQYYSQSGSYFPYIPAILSRKELDSKLLSMPKKTE